MFGKISPLKPLDPGLCFVGRILITDSKSLLEIDLFRFSTPSRFSSASYMFLGIYSLLLGSHVCWCKIVVICSSGHMQSVMILYVCYQS